MLARYARIAWTTIASPAAGASLSPDEIRQREAAALIKELGRGATVGLADCGVRYTSEEFAEFVNRLQVSGAGRVSFLIGGPYGLDETVLDRCNHVVSLSPLTFSHQLVRLVLLEQLYRGFSILHGSGYHK